MQPRATTKDMDFDFLTSPSGESMEYPTEIFIRNTFIEAHPPRSPSFDRFFEERKIQSAPSSGLYNGQGEETGPPPLELPPKKDRQEGSECSTAETPRNVGVAQVTPLQLGPLRSAPAAADDDLRSFRRAATWGGGLGSTAVRLEASAWAPGGPLGTFTTPGPEPPGAPGASPASSPSTTSTTTTTGASPTQKPSAKGAPSVGSAAHGSGRCKPCAFFNTKGCESSAECRFCHLCEPGEKKKRRKEKLQLRNAARSTQRLADEAWGGGLNRFRPSYSPRAQ